MVQARAGASQGGQSRISLGSWPGAGVGRGRRGCCASGQASCRVHWLQGLQRPSHRGTPQSCSAAPPSPLCSGAWQAGLPGAHSFSCSRESGDEPPPSWSRVSSCLSLSCPCRSGAASSSSSRPHCVASLGDTEKRSLSARTPCPRAGGPRGGCVGSVLGRPGPVSPSSRQRSWEMVATVDISHLGGGDPVSGWEQPRLSVPFSPGALDPIGGRTQALGALAQAGPPS